MILGERKATLRDGQDAGEMLLDIEARIGELLPEATKTHIPRRDMAKGPAEKSLPEGIDYRRAYKARTIAKHPEIVEKVKAKARENEDIPTKTAVISEIIRNV